MPPAARIVLDWRNANPSHRRIQQTAFMGIIVLPYVMTTGEHNHLRRIHLARFQQRTDGQLLQR